MKKLGVLGGMGPLATVVFYHRLVEACSPRPDQEHIETLLWSHTTLPDRTKSIAGGEKTRRRFVNLIREDLKMLKREGCEVIAIPCNTSHYFYDLFNEDPELEILNMVEGTIRHIAEHDPEADKIAVFATEGTNGTGVYEKYAEHYGISTVKLDPADQKIISDIIYGVKRTSSRDYPKLNYLIAKYLKAGARKIILACTELSLVNVDEALRTDVVDAMDILVELSRKACL